MGQDALVNEQLDAGGRLLKALADDGFEVAVAFWAKPTDEERWFLYLATPAVDERGPSAAYRDVYATLRGLAESWIDPFDVRLVGVSDPMAVAAAEAVKPRVPNDPFAVRSPKPSQGVTRFGGARLGGVGVDGAYIYPPPQPAAA